MRSLTNDAVFHQVRLDLSIERALVTVRKRGVHLPIMQVLNKIRHVFDKESLVCMD